MEYFKISEKAECYHRRNGSLLVRPKFVEVSEIKNYKKENSTKYCEHEKRGGVFSKLLLLIVIFAMGFLSFKIIATKSNTVGKELSSVVEMLFAPKDFGKIKFVGNNKNENIDLEAYLSASDFSLPFLSCSAVNVCDVFLLSSPSEITIRSMESGVVESVKTDEKTLKKSIIINHGQGLKSEYYLLDNVGVKEGDNVSKNSVIGLSFSMQIGLKLSYKNMIVKGLEIVDGNLSFC